MCLVLDRPIEANQALNQALRLGIKDPNVLKLLGSAFLSKSQPAAAVESLRLALELNSEDLDTQELFKKALTFGSKSFLDESSQLNVPKVGLAI